MATKNIPNNAANIVFDPFNTDLRGFILAAVQKYISQMQTCIPAIVKKVESRDTVIVTPAVQQLDANWQAVNWADIRLPVYTPAGGKFLLSAPLTAGDTGYIIAGDLDPALFNENPKNPAPQKRLDRHNYQFGYFVPSKIGKLNLTAPADAFVISTEDGTTQISLQDGSISIKTTSELRIEGQNVIIQGMAGVQIGGNVAIAGNLQFTGTINGQNFATHTHAVGSLTVPMTSREGSPSTITGDTGGVSS